MLDSNFSRWTVKSRLSVGEKQLIHRRFCVGRISFLLAILFATGLNSSQAQGTWIKKAGFGGGGRAYIVGFSIGTKGYMGTGYDGSTSKKDFWEYDPATDAWTQKADFGGTARY